MRIGALRVPSDDGRLRWRLLDQVSVHCERYSEPRVALAALGVGVLFGAGARYVAGRLNGGGRDSRGASGAPATGSRFAAAAARMSRYMSRRHGAVRARGRTHRLAVAPPSYCLAATAAAALHRPAAPPPAAAACTAPPRAPRRRHPTRLHRPTENFPHRAGKIDGAPRPVNKFGKTHGALAAGAAFRRTESGVETRAPFTRLARRNLVPLCT